MAQAYVRPARHTNYNTELMTSVRGIHGYEAYCACGWTGLTWKTWGEAQAESRWHYYITHGVDDAAPKREDEPPSGVAEAF